MPDLRADLVRAAQEYDDFADPERLAEAALERLADRVRRAGVVHARCAGCGESLADRRPGAKTCSDRCRKRLSRLHAL